MKSYSLALCFAGCVLVVSDPPAGTVETSPTFADELVLRGAGLTTDGPGLLDFFRKRARERADPARLTALIRQLDDPTPETREKAVAELVSIGPAAVPWLRRLVKDPDTERLTGAARRCLAILDSEAASNIPAAAARLLAVRQPADTVPVLLRYLPHADNEAVIDEVKATLAALAYRDDKPDPALLQALGDPLSIRRAAAVDVLCHAGIAEPRAALRTMLKDPKLIVRLRAALALADVKEQEAVATLIELLGELPVAYGKQVEEYLLNLAGDQAPKATLGKEDSRKKCAAAWANWWQASEGGGKLLEEVRKRTVREADRGKVLALIRKLGDDGFENREKAQYELLAMGTAVVGYLKLALTDPDVEVSTRAGQLLSRIEKSKTAAISQVTIRLISYRKPAGSSEALLSFLPFVEDEGTREEVQDALNALAIQDGKADPILVKALQDKNPLWRAAAAEALGQPGAPEEQALVRKLFQDPVPVVRMRAALALAGARDRGAVPVLIASLADLPPDQSAPAEEFLAQLAGERSPPGVAGGDAAARQKRRDTWAGWWKDHGAQVRLVFANRGGMRQYYFGYTLIALPNSGQIQELGTDNKPHWTLTNLQNPMDVHVLPGNRVLIAEYGANQVTERNLKNEILWQKQVNNPISCQRLPSGNTFIVTRNLLMEVDRSGKEVAVITRGTGDIMAARKMRDGQIILVSNQSFCARLDGTGKELRRFSIPNNGGTHYIDITRRGHVIVPEQWNNKIFEFDPDGKKVWEGDVQQPISAARLPNGNTLVSSQWWPYKIFELDKTGKVVWEYQSQNYAGRVRRR